MDINLQIVILGCGSSGGVPRIGGEDGAGNWGKCDPNEPKNRRGRCALLVRRIGKAGTTTILVDAGTDIREQLLRERVPSVDAVLFTHEHADHIHGMDDLRVIAVGSKKRLPVYFDRRAAKSIVSRFRYCFEMPAGSDYPPILAKNFIEDKEQITIKGKGGDIDVIPIEVKHGNITAFGYRFGGLVYTPDVSDVPLSSRDLLSDLDCWIIDSLGYNKHVAHFNVSEALSWVKRLRAKRGILTNMHNALDYATLLNLLPPIVEPGYDGLKIDIIIR